MFVNATIDGTGYCGPTVLSAITGIGTSYISRIARQDTKRRCIKGMSNKQLEKVLNFFSIKFEKKTCKGTVNQWVYDYRRRDVTYILNVTNHYIAIRNDQVICTQFKGVITPLSGSKYLRTQVKAFWIIESEPKKVKLPEPPKPKRKTSPPEKKKVLALCEEHNVQIDFDDFDHDGSPIWLYLSDDAIKEKFDGVDPWDDNHYAYDYEEALEKLTDLFMEV